MNIFLKELTPLRKWIKNFIRTFVCFLSCLILILAGNSVQTMQNICFAIFTIPITLLFPPMFHLIKCTDNNIPAKIIDILLIFVSLNVLAICIYSRWSFSEEVEKRGEGNKRTRDRDTRYLLADVASSEGSTR